MAESFAKFRKKAETLVAKTKTLLSTSFLPLLHYYLATLQRASRFQNRPFLPKKRDDFRGNDEGNLRGETNLSSCHSCANMTPPKLDYASSTYLTISTKIAPESILPSPSSPSSYSHSSQGSSQSSELNTTLSYVGPVGQLPNEYIYELPGVPSSNPPAREVQDVKKWLQEKEGVKAVEVMVPQMRNRRHFEC